MQEKYHSGEMLRGYLGSRPLLETERPPAMGVACFVVVMGSGVILPVIVIVAVGKGWVVVVMMMAMRIERWLMGQGENRPRG